MLIIDERFRTMGVNARVLAEFPDAVRESAARTEVARARSCIDALAARLTRFDPLSELGRLNADRAPADASRATWARPSAPRSAAPRAPRASSTRRCSEHSNARATRRRAPGRRRSGCARRCATLRRGHLVPPIRRRCGVPSRSRRICGP